MLHKTDIEDITGKTGNFKRFHVFCKMLVSAVKQARSPPP